MTLSSRLMNKKIRIKPTTTTKYFCFTSST